MYKLTSKQHIEIRKRMNVFHFKSFLTIINNLLMLFIMDFIVSMLVSMYELPDSVLFIGSAACGIFVVWRAHPILKGYQEILRKEIEEITKQ